MHSPDLLRFEHSMCFLRPKSCRKKEKNTVSAHIFWSLKKAEYYVVQ